MPQDRLTAAIAAGDVAALSSIKGVGKKTAERIALELKSKIADVFGAAVGGDVGQAIQLADEDAVLALVSLGYERKEAEAAVRKVAKPDMTTEQLIRAVLRG